MAALAWVLLALVAGATVYSALVAGGFELITGHIAQPA